MFCPGGWPMPTCPAASTKTSPTTWYRSPKAIRSSAPKNPHVPVSWPDSGSIKSWPLSSKRAAHSRLAKSIFTPTTPPPSSPWCVYWRPRTFQRRTFRRALCWSTRMSRSWRCASSSTSPITPILMCDWRKWSRCRIVEARSGAPWVRLWKMSRLARLVIGKPSANCLVAMSIKRCVKSEPLRSFDHCGLEWYLFGAITCDVLLWKLHFGGISSETTES